MDSATVTAILILAAIVMLVATSLADRFKSRRAMLRRIADAWGKEAATKYKQEDFLSIASYFANPGREHEAGFAIDDITWRDLDMDDVFVRLNNTGSTIGEECLYKLLREPSFEPGVLTERQKLIEFFQNDPAKRLELQILLAKLGKKRFINVTDYFFGSDTRQPWKAARYRILAAFAIVAPAFLIVDIGLGLLLICASFLTNLLVCARARPEIEADLAAYGYIVSMVRCARKILYAEIAGLEALNGRLRMYFGKIKRIERKTYYLFYARTGALSDVLFEYVKIALLRELIEYEYLRKAISERHSELKEAYDIIGLIDGMISVASYRASIPFHTIPRLDKYPDVARHLEFVDIGHPLMKNPVPNSLRMNQPVLITGSNASGKSTLLKAIAINAIFAQTICTCLAREYSSSMYAIFSSMALRDNVLHGESYFVVEIKSIKRILDYLNDEVPCLCLIDEVLRGTNTVERIAASSQVLAYLARHNCSCLAATHDIELTYILEKLYRSVHFQEAISDEGIIFDYKLYDGRATSRNAIRLLSLIGYSDAIVKEAERHASLFMEQGTWQAIS